MKTDKSIVILIVVALLAVLVSFEDENEKAMILDDFDNNNEGTIMFWTDMNLPKEILRRDYLLLFASDRINGLKIIYDFSDWRLKAGIPLINSEKEVYFDGSRHHIAYTFKKKSEQVLYFDGNIVASGLYDDEMDSPLTGLAVYEYKEAMDASYEAEDVGVYDKALSEEEIKEMINR